jgi:hypothetical protein
MSWQHGIISIKMSWSEHLARMGQGEVHTGFWFENLREGNHFEDLGADESIIKIKWIFKKWDGGMDWIGELGHVTESGECGKEIPGSIKYGEFLN